MCEYLQGGVLLEKLPSCRKDNHEQLEHKRKDFTFKELIGHIKINEENRLGSKGYYIHNSTNVNLLESFTKFDRFKWRNLKVEGPKFNKGRPNNSPSEKLKASRGVSKPKSKGVFYACGKPGHNANYCPQSKDKPHAHLY